MELEWSAVNVFAMSHGEDDNQDFVPNNAANNAMIFYSVSPKTGQVAAQ